MVEVDPAAEAGNDALGAKDHAVFFGIVQCIQALFDLTHGELSCRLHAPAGKDFISVMMVMFVIMVVAAGALPVVVMMLMVVIVVVAAGALLIVVMMLMVVIVVVAAGALLIVVRMLMVVIVVVAAGALLVVVMMMLMVMIVVMTAVAFLIVMVMMVVLLLFHRFQILGKRIILLHGIHDLTAGQFAPGGGDDSRCGILIPQQVQAGMQLFFGNRICSAENDGGGGFNLIVVELTEVFHIHFALVGIGNGHKAAQFDFMAVKLFDGSHNIGELANAGGLDQNAVGMVLLDDLRQGAAKVTDEGTADAAGVHFGHFNACILQEAAVNTDLTEFVFDEDELFARVGLCDQLLNQCGFAGTEEAGENVDSSHSNTFVYKNLCP